MQSWIWIYDALASSIWERKKKEKLNREQISKMKQIKTEGTTLKALQDYSYRAKSLTQEQKLLQIGWVEGRKISERFDKR